MPNCHTVGDRTTTRDKIGVRAWAEAHEPKTTGMRIFVKLDGGAVKLPGGVITTLNNVEASDTIESVVNRTWWDNQNLINGADGERGGFTSASCWARYSSVWVEPRAEPDKDDGRQEKKPRVYMNLDLVLYDTLALHKIQEGSMLHLVLAQEHLTACDQARLLMADELASLSIRMLKSRLVELGESVDGCVEKPDLVRKLAEALNAAAAATAAADDDDDDDDDGAGGDGDDVRSARPLVPTMPKGRKEKDKDKSKEPAKARATAPKVSVVRRVEHNTSCEVASWGSWTGNCYHGDLEGNKAEGRGTFVFSDGSSWEGAWRAGEPAGQGTWVLPGGCGLYRGLEATGVGPVRAEREAPAAPDVWRAADGAQAPVGVAAQTAQEPSTARERARCGNPSCAKVEEKERFNRCSRCMSIAYCGVACQRAHWKAHKVVCVAHEPKQKQDKVQLLEAQLDEARDDLARYQRETSKLLGASFSANVVTGTESELSLGGSSFECSEKILTALRAHTTLEKLTLNGDASFAPPQLTAIFTAVLGSHAALLRDATRDSELPTNLLAAAAPLAELCLDRISGFDPAACQTLAEELRGNSTLTTLSISDVECVGDEEAKVLAEAVRGNTTLKNLTLSCAIDLDAGAEAFADCICANSCLESLDIRANSSIAHKAVIQMARALGGNTTLTVRAGCCTPPILPPPRRFATAPRLTPYPRCAPAASSVSFVLVAFISAVSGHERDAPALRRVRGAARRGVRQQHADNDVL